MSIVSLGLFVLGNTFCRSIRNKFESCKDPGINMNGHHVTEHTSNQIQIEQTIHPGLAPFTLGVGVM